MIRDVELEGWRREWQSAEPALPDLVKAVRRHSRRMRAMLASEILLTVVMGGGLTTWAVRSRDANVVVLASAAWIFFAAAWSFVGINRRGCWTPVNLSQAALLDLSIRRCRRGRIAAIFAVILYFLELVFCLVWVYRRTAQPSVELFLLSTPVIVVGICTVIFGTSVVWYRRKKGAELDYLLKLQRSL